MSETRPEADEPEVIDPTGENERAGAGEAVRAAPRIHVVLTTVPGVEAAATLGRQLVERRLAACVNVVPGLRSFFVWQGQLQDEPETLLLIKTAADLETLFSTIRELHPYELPELVALPAGPVEASFARWVREASAAV